MAKFLSETGLQTVWSKIDSLFVRKASVSSSNNTASFGSAVTVGSVGGVDLKFTMPSNPVSSNTVTTSDTLTADKIVLGNGSKTVKTSGKGITTTAPSSSSDDTTIPTSKAVWSAFGSVASALKYKGTIGSSGATITALPATHAVGDMYAVKTAGTYVGKACEVGDYIICHTAGTTANNAHWDVLNGENQVENKSASLAAAGSSATIATVDGTDITVTTPSGWTGLTKTGTITKVGNTTSGEVAVSVTSGGATIGTSATTIATIGGVAVQAKIGSYASSGHDHNTTYLKLDGSNVMTGNLLFNMGDTDKFVVFSYQNTGVASSNSWRMGALGSGTGDANYYVVQYQTVNASGTNAGTWNTAFKIGQSTGVVNFTNNPTIGSNVNIHAGNYNSSTYADTTPTQNSTKLITSGGMYTVLDEIESTIAASEDALDTRITTLENNTVTGSGLTANKIVLGNGTRTIKTSSKEITTTAPSSSSDDTTIPTSKAVNSAIVSHAGVDKTGTVTSVTLTQGTGITVSSSGTAITGSGSRTISLASVSGLTTGTYRSVTVDTYGRVTAGTNPTTLSGYGITDAKIASGVITLGSNTITPLTSASTLDATKLSGTIPSGCYTNTDIRLADFFGESTNTASTVAKTTSTTSKSIASGDLVTGFCAIIYHKYANSAASATLNVGGSGDKAMYNAAGTRISGSTGTWTAKDIIRWVYDTSLNSNAGGWKISAILGNGDSHRLRLLTGRTPLYSETYQGTVTSVTLTQGTGITVSDSGTAITSSGSRTISLNKATTSTIGGMIASNALTTSVSLTSGDGTTANRYYGVQVDKDGKAFVNVPWSNVNSSYLTSHQSLGLITASSATATTENSSDSTNTTTFLNLLGGGALKDSIKVTGAGTVSVKSNGGVLTITGSGATDAITGIKLSHRNSVGGTENVQNSSGTDITYTPSSGIATMNVVPSIRQDAGWGDWVWYWETSQGKGKAGIAYKSNSATTSDTGEVMFAGTSHFMNQLTFAASSSYTPGTVNTGKIAAVFYGMAPSNVGTTSCEFYIQCKAYDPTDSWKNFVNFRFSDAGIYKYFPSDCPNSNLNGQSYWILDESMALTNSEIDTILANAT